MSKSITPLAQGRRLAIALLREYRDIEAEECSCEDHFRPGREQRDVLGKYLELLIASSNEVRAGFCVVINDFLATADDIATDVEFYEKLEAEGYDRNAVYFPSSRAANVSEAISSRKQRA
jgi:hypothetical protein